MSYTSLLTIVCLANLLQFVLRPRIFILEKKSHLYSNEDKKPANQSSARKAVCPFRISLIPLNLKLNLRRKTIVQM